MKFSKYTRCRCGAITLYFDDGNVFVCDKKDIKKNFPDIDIRYIRPSNKSKTHSCMRCLHRHQIKEALEKENEAQKELNYVKDNIIKNIQQVCPTSNEIDELSQADIVKEELKDTNTVSTLLKKIKSLTQQEDMLNKKTRLVLQEYVN